MKNRLIISEPKFSVLPPVAESKPMNCRVEGFPNKHGEVCSS